MLYPITTIAAVILGLWLFWLSARIIAGRRNAGENPDADQTVLLERRVRAQANLCEYAPVALVLLFLAEAQGAHFWLVAVSALLLVVGRLLHGIAMSFAAKWVFGRLYGMLMTFASILLLSVINLWLVVIPTAIKACRFLLDSPGTL